MSSNHIVKQDAVELEKLKIELVKTLKRLAVITALFAADCEIQARYLKRYKMNI